ncbi:hypothetical protein SMC26_36530 [Actinomadura fulvescens]|uniref:Ricin B lectin domain-containing protein n=1 Tax=Actinomadura fulvescens TaxID=46160 RepID=A0ABN3P980_9ACTN
MPAKTGVPDGVRRTVPQPEGAHTPAEFLTSLRKLQSWSGLSVEELESRLRDPGGVPVPGGLSALLSGDLLPGEELLSEFLVACGCVPEVRARWLEVHARLAAVRSVPPSLDSGPDDVQVAGTLSVTPRRRTNTLIMPAEQVPAEQVPAEQPPPWQVQTSQPPPPPWLAQPQPIQEPPHPTHALPPQPLQPQPQAQAQAQAQALQIQPHHVREWPRPDMQWRQPDREGTLPLQELPTPPHTEDEEGQEREAEREEDVPPAAAGNRRRGRFAGTRRSDGGRRASAERRTAREPRTAGRHRSTGELPVVDAPAQAAEPAPARAGRHRASGEFPVVTSGRQRPKISAPAATVSLITVAAVVFALVSSADGGKDREAGKASRQERTAAALPPEDGLYMISPVTGEPNVNCLAIMNDNALRPTLSQHACLLEDPTERFELQSLSKGGHVLKGRAAEGEKLRCVTLDGTGDGARLRLMPCVPDDERQRFTFDPTGPPPVNGTAIFRMLPVSTHANGMCVGIDPVRPGTVHAVHTSCFRAGVRGFTFTAASGS